MTQPSPRLTLEQVIAGYVQDCESGKSVDPEQLLQRYSYLQPDLREFIEGNAQFIEAAQAARDELDAASVSALTTHPSIVETLSRGQVVPPRRSSSSLALNPPKIFGDYAIVEEIDRGGMGVVYKATHVHLGRTVALKLIRSGELASNEEIQRFRIEAEAAGALTHPGIVPIFEVGQLHDLVYYTMAYIDGQSLSDIVEEGGLDPQEAMRILYKLCAAVAYAHRNGVYHRDLKPANVLLDRSGQPIIIDFGLAKNANRDQSLTMTGQILGTPAYMPPEQATGKAVIGPASDVYSLGAILYYLCAGQAPFSGPTPFDILLQVLDRDPPAPSKLNRRVSRELDYICQKALAKDPQARYQTADELATDLQTVLRGEPLDCPRTRFIERLESWWRREPILFSHVCGIGATTLIAAVAHWIRNDNSPAFPYRMGLLFVWLIASFVLQRWVMRARYRDMACLSWAAVDVVLYTTLVAIADPPRSMLLIGYPMMMVASSLFYRKRFVGFMTTLCIVGFLVLAIFSPEADFRRIDFCAIFLCGLGVICLTLLAMIRRMRGMSSYFEEH